MSQPNWANHNCLMGQTIRLLPPTEKGTCVYVVVRKTDEEGMVCVRMEEGGDVM